MGKHHKKHSKHRSSSSSDSDSSSSISSDSNRKSSKSKNDRKHSSSSRDRDRDRDRHHKRVKIESNNNTTAASNTASYNSFQSESAAAITATGIPPTFIWHKKHEKAAAAAASQNQSTATATIVNSQLILSASEYESKQQRIKSEIEQLKARRLARIIEQQELTELRESQQRETLKESMIGYAEAEEQFHRTQSIIRSELRISENRAKPIDLLIQPIAINQTITQYQSVGIEVINRSSIENSNRLKTAATAELIYPPDLISNLTLNELIELLSDINNQIELQEQLQYWGYCKLLTEMECKKRDQSINNQSDSNNSNNNNTVVSSIVQQEIIDLLSNKSLSQLHVLQQQVNSTIQSARSNPVTAAGLDINYWNSVSNELKLYIARAWLREYWNNLIEQQQLLQREQPQLLSNRSSNNRIESNQTIRVLPLDSAITDLLDSNNSIKSESIEYDTTIPLSPVLLPLSAIRSLNVPIIDELTDLQLLTEARNKVTEQRQRDELEQSYRNSLANSDTGITAIRTNNTAISQSNTATATTTDSAAYNRESSQPLSSDEIQFQQEIHLASQQYSWNDKYRPRKPRYFNRVKTGFDWNRYNQTHYDRDNPPPKTVQGYKFNIFYTDLINNSESPKFKLLSDTNNDPNYCIIQFISGAPYEDIAFRIVKKEWEYSRKHGYKCVFDKGILQLHFNFRRYFYRR